MNPSEPASSDAWLSTRQAVALALLAVIGHTAALGLLDRDLAVTAVTVNVALIYAVYLGFTLMRGTVRAFWTEVPFLGVGIGLAVAGATLGPVWLGVALVLHGAWDLLHHPDHHVLGVRGVPRWYVPMCAFFDIPAGVAVMIQL